MRHIVYVGNGGITTRDAIEISTQLVGAANFNIVYDAAGDQVQPHENAVVFSTKPCEKWAYRCGAKYHHAREVRKVVL